MEELDKILNLIASQKGGTPKDYRLLMDTIGYLESHNIVDRKQMEGGPGRGIYQYEKGKNASASVAARRTRQYYAKNNIKEPQWLKATRGARDLDASKFTKNQQSILFLGDKMGRKGADFSKVWDGSKSVEDFYLDSHWAGSIEDRAEKRDYFRRGAAEFNKEQGVSNTFDSSIKLQGDGRVPSYTTKRPTPREALIKEYSPQNLSIKNFQDNNQPKQVEPTTPSFVNDFRSGGIAASNSYNNGGVATYDSGGTHAQNSLGGIPIGMGANGLPNTVEEGEASFESQEGKYIFSNYVNLDGTINKQ